MKNSCMPGNADLRGPANDAKPKVQATRSSQAAVISAAYLLCYEDQAYIYRLVLTGICKKP